MTDTADPLAPAPPDPTAHARPLGNVVPTTSGGPPERDATGTPHDAAAHPRPHRLLAAAAFTAPVVTAAVLGSRFNPTGSTGRWYRHLQKPPFQPPPQVFAPVWSVLYATIAASGYRVWAAPDHRLRRPAIALWATQLAANAAWTPTFFGARRPRAALAVLGAQFAATVAYTVVAAPVDGTASALMGPYVGWSAFAGALNEEIVRRNPDA
jgi:benzodiazapine receptor